MMAPIRASPKGMPTPSPIASNFGSMEAEGVVAALVGEAVDEDEVVDEDDVVEENEVVDEESVGKAAEVVVGALDCGKEDDGLVGLPRSPDRSTIVPTGTVKLPPFWQQELGSGPQQYDGVVLGLLSATAIGHGKRLLE